MTLALYTFISLSILIFECKYQHTSWTARVCLSLWLRSNTKHVNRRFSFAFLPPEFSNCDFCDPQTRGWPLTPGWEHAGHFLCPPAGPCLVSEAGRWKQHKSKQTEGEALICLRGHQESQTSVWCYLHLFMPTLTLTDLKSRPFPSVLYFPLLSSTTTNSKVDAFEKGYSDVFVWWFS